MTASALSGIATVVSITALGVSVAGMWISRKSLRSNVYAKTTDFTLEIDRMFLAHPELRPYFFHDREPPADDQVRFLVESAAEMLLDVLEAIWDEQDQLPKRDRIVWREWIHECFEQSPALRAMYQRSKDWYPTLRGFFDDEPCTRHETHVAVRLFGPVV